jgi:acetolactate synthase-1/2/3 large subunit
MKIDLKQNDKSLRHPAPQRGKALYGSDLMIDLIADMGAEYVFLNPGSSFRGLHDSLVNYHGNRAPEVVLVTHEMIAVAMAHGYWKATKKPAVCMLHNLVGLMNGSMAIFNAFCDQVPLLIYGGSGPADPKDRRYIDWAHSANTQGDLVRSYVKWTDEPATLEATLDAMALAQRKALTAPQGPVYISIDAGQQELEAGDLTAPDPHLPRYSQPAPVWPHPDAVRAVADLLMSCNQPLVIGGRFGRDHGVSADMARLVDLTGAGYIDERSANVCLATRHPGNLTGDRGFRGLADAILCFDVQDLTGAIGGYGSKRSAVMGVGAAAKGATVVDISLNDQFGNSWSRIGGPTPPLDLQIAADPALALKALVAELESRAAGPHNLGDRQALVSERHVATRAKQAETLKKRWDESPIALERLTHDVFQAVKGDDWVLTTRNHRTWPEGYWEFTASGQYLGSDGGGGVGYGPGAAIGAAMGLKGTGKLPVALIGDGDFMMTAGAIWTGVHHRAPLLMVIQNNRSWGNDELHQREIAALRGRSPATAHIGQTTLDPEVDICGVARSFGAIAIGPVTDPAELPDALARAAQMVRDGALVVVEVITALE